jgi:ferritin-like metal-binding protein YciE
MEIKNLEDLYLNGLQYVYDAEKQLTEALPKMAQTASTPQFKEALEQHLKETQEHVKRAEQLFSNINQKPETRPNNIIQAIREEVDKMSTHISVPAVRDAALIVAGNQVEHYEMSAYGSLLNYARLLNRPGCVELLQQTLDEEKAADAKLTEVGENFVNKAALNQNSASAGAR